MARILLTKKHLLAMSLCILFYQNCNNSVQFGQTPRPSDELFWVQSNSVSFLKMSMNSSTSFVAKNGETYSIQVDASDDVLASGIDSSATRLVRVSGSCGSNHIMPWTQEIDLNAQSTTVPGFINRGLPAAWTYVSPMPAGNPAVGSIQVSESAFVDKNSFSSVGLIDASMQNQIVDLVDPQVLSKQTLNLVAIAAAPNTPLSPSNPSNNPIPPGSPSTQISFGSNQIFFRKAAADALGGCDWLACVRSNSGLEACLMIKAEKPIPLACNLSGVPVLHGSSVTAYQSASVPFGSSCQSETRNCNDGTLSGTFANASCSVAAPVSCALNGVSVAHGSSATAYQAASVAFGGTCTAETRTCTNGTLSGSFANSSCSVAAPIACSFGGVSIAHGANVTAYQSAVVPFGGTCAAQTRTCSNGTLSGTFSSSSCSVAAPLACSFNGSSVAHGANVTAYQSAVVPFGGTCAAQTRTCSNGTLSGTFANSNCSVGAPSACSFNGASVAHNASVTAYQAASVAFGSTCTAETRTCTNGTLSGTFANSNCSVAAPLACSFNGVSVAHGSNVTAYQSAGVPFGGTCTAETRTCTNGTLSGTFANSNCSVGAPSACSFNGASVAHTNSVTAYQAASVPFGSTCTAETRTCTNGTLSGSFTNSNCSVAAPLVCSFNGVSVAHNASVTAYQSSSVPFGGTCAAQIRTCSNGTLSGTFTNSACSVGAPSACSFNGASVAHNASVTAYQSSSVPFGGTCTAENRTCTNGTLSGSFTNSNCSVTAPVACSFNGLPVAHGASVTAFQSASVTYGGSCAAETRTCSNGSLLGSYAHSSCSVGTLTELCQSIGAETLPGVGCKFHVPGNFQIASPSGARQVKVTVIGGGGGASSQDNNQWSGAHGAGGGAAIKTFTVIPGQNMDFQVGSGGTAGTGSSGGGFGQMGTSGSPSNFSYQGTTITAAGGESATVWARVYQAFTTNYAPCFRGGCPGFNAPTDPTLGGGGIGGDVNCNGGNGGFCLNNYFNCAASSAPLCDGATSGLSQPGGGGGGASRFGGNGVAQASDWNGCGGGGAYHIPSPTLTATLPDQTRRGSHGCVILEWLP